MELPGAAGAIDPTERRVGFLVGAVIGAGLAASTAHAREPDAVRAALRGGDAAVLAPPAGRRRAATALADGLLVDLTGGGVDLHGVVRRWLEWRRDDGLDVAPPLAAALDHLQEFDAPADALPAGNVAALAATLPAALASGSPRAMVSGTFHVARLLDPRPITGLAAVAIVLAGAAFLDGRRDFVADVVAALRANDAPPEILEPIRMIPRDPQIVPPAPTGRAPDPITATVWLLWLAYHRPRAVTALREMTLGGNIGPEVGAVLGALVGARDGIAPWPVAWSVEVAEEVLLRRAMAQHLGC